MSTDVVDDRKSKRRLGALALSWWGFLGIVIVYAVHGSMDATNPVELPLEKQLSTVSYLPEGWKFFTRDAREDISLLYKQDSTGHWMRADSGENASRHNLFGLSRAGRNEGIESGIILTSIPSDAYESCEADADTCLQSQNPKLRMESGATRPVFCGKMGVVVTPRVPWAWSRSPKPPTMKTKVVIVEVSC
jgi:antimicrobial peptide system SdpA family protein